MSNNFNYVLHIFPGEATNFCRGGFSPLVTGLHTPVSVLRDAGERDHCPPALSTGFDKDRLQTNLLQLFTHPENSR